MTDIPKKRDPTLTIVGMPAFIPGDEEPFPLTAYADVHTYTPSGQRTHTQMLPPPLPTVPRAPYAVAPALRALEPSNEAKWIAVCAVCWVIVLGTLFWL